MNDGGNLDIVSAPKDGQLLKLLIEYDNKSKVLLPQGSGRLWAYGYFIGNDSFIYTWSFDIGSFVRGYGKPLYWRPLTPDEGYHISLLIFKGFGL